MTNPLVKAFFLGRATAEVLSEEIQHQVMDLVSSVGRFDAEQRDRIQQFQQTVMARAEAEASATATQSGNPTAPGNGTAAPGMDVQATLDELRAEVAQLRSTLQRVRQS
jgi:hypothetical protein